MARQDVGWGIEGDSFQALGMLSRYGLPSWFQVGDRDLATHIFRSGALRRGETLSAVTAAISRRLEVRARVLPMTDDPVATRLRSRGEWLDFQEYFVQRRHRDPVDEIRYEGIEAARPTEAVLEAVREAEALLLVNSNPVLSILPILALSRMREAVQESRARRVAISPIVGRQAVSGPAGDLMTLIGQPSSAAGVAAAYHGLIDGIVIDARDEDQVPEIEALGLEVLCTDAIMRNLADRERLAAQALDFARGLP
jgi:LPPG:FO 2-phospho-L-lactate transferase